MAYQVQDASSHSTVNWLVYTSSPMNGMCRRPHSGDTMWPHKTEARNRLWWRDSPIHPRASQTVRLGCSTSGLNKKTHVLDRGVSEDMDFFSSLSLAMHAPVVHYPMTTESTYQPRLPSRAWAAFIDYSESPTHRGLHPMNFLCICDKNLTSPGLSKY